MKPPHLAPGDQLVKRREAANLYGCSDPTIRRFERDGSLTVVWVDAAGVHWHSRNAVLALKEKRAAAAAGPSVEIGGGVAGDAFAAFDDGATAADVVKTLRIAPNLARQLQDQWADLAGGFFIGGLVRARLVEMMSGYDDTNPVASGEDLLRLLDHMDVPRCASGCQSWARFCMACFRNRPRQALHVVAQEVAAMEERKKQAAEREARKRAVEQARHARRVERRAMAEEAPRDRSPGESRPVPDSPPPAKRRRRRAPSDSHSASAPIPQEEARVTADHDVTALTAQIRKTVDLMKRREPLSEEDASELRTCLAMLEGQSKARLRMTDEQAEELASVMDAFREAAIANGVQLPSFEESSPLATDVESAPHSTEVTIAAAI